MFNVQEKNTLTRWEEEKNGEKRKKRLLLVSIVRGEHRWLDFDEEENTKHQRTMWTAYNNFKLFDGLITSYNIK